MVSKKVKSWPSLWISIHKKLVAPGTLIQAKKLCINDAFLVTSFARYVIASTHIILKLVGLFTINLKIEPVTVFVFFTQLKALWKLQTFT